jgi:hypothetical protein
MKLIRMRFLETSYNKFHPDFFNRSKVNSFTLLWLLFHVQYTLYQYGDYNAFANNQISSHRNSVSPYYLHVSQLRDNHDSDALTGLCISVNFNSINTIFHLLDHANDYLRAPYMFITN